MHFNAERYWNKEGATELYKPERFLQKETDSAEVKFMRPRHFKPFSHGKRSCMGYKIVETVTLSLAAALMER